MKNEIRAIDFETAEFRFGDHDKRTVEGYASVFGVPTDLGRFSETSQQGAISRALEPERKGYYPPALNHQPPHRRDNLACHPGAAGVERLCHS